MEDLKNAELPEQKNANLEAALDYLNRGFSVIPVGRDKKPLIKWQRYQDERATQDEVKQWFKDFQGANIGIVTGAISGIVVVDIEADGSTSNLPPTVMSKSGGGGWHFYYKHPSHAVKNAVRIADKTDIRGDGGYVVAPPSTHKSGKKYEWSVDFDMADLAELPHWVLEKSKGVEANKVDWQKFILEPNAEGSRNMSAAQLSGKLLYHLPVELWETAGWATIKDWNDRQNTPPLTEKELRVTWDSIKKAEFGKRAFKKSGSTASRSNAELLLDLIEKIGLTYFRNELKELFVILPIQNHNENWRVSSKVFKQWLAREFWMSLGKPISSEALNNALRVIEGMARFEGMELNLSNRITWFEGAIWYDLTNPEWSAVKIDKSGWQVEQNPPVLFRRYAHQQAQVIPLSGGDVKRICDFVNIKNEGQRLLFMVYLVSCFIPDFPHPVLSIYGAQGSAKSTLFKFLRKLIDPSSIEVVGFSKDISELAQLLAHHWCIFFDNISVLPSWISDMLCKAVSGDGFSKRELYSDDDDIIYSFKRCIGINGINLVASKPDLLERSILLELERVSQSERKQEKDLLQEFNHQRAYILGGIMDTIVIAQRIQPTIHLTTHPRMADFAVWGCAIAEALGHSQKEFIDAYYENIDHQNEQVLGESLIATAVRSMLQDRLEWEGTASELLTELTQIALDQGIKTDRERDWPKAANTLSRRLNELKTNLATDGIQYKRFGKSKNRYISLRKESDNTVETVESPIIEIIRDKMGIDSIDDISNTSSPVSSPQNSLLSMANDDSTIETI